MLGVECVDNILFGSQVTDLCRLYNRNCTFSGAGTQTVLTTKSRSCVVCALVPAMRCSVASREQVAAPTRVLRGATGCLRLSDA